MRQSRDRTRVSGHLNPRLELEVEAQWVEVVQASLRHAGSSGQEIELVQVRIDAWQDGQEWAGQTTREVVGELGIEVRAELQVAAVK